MSVEEFLLRDRAGHCEYIAAGMVVIVAAVALVTSSKLKQADATVPLAQCEAEA